MGSGKLSGIVETAKPAIVMVIVQLFFGGVTIFNKLALNDGMNSRILVAYRFLFATAFMLPLAFILERKRSPKLTWMIALQGFLCGFFGGSLAQNLSLESLDLTSATFSAAMANLIPVVTFIFAISFGLEKAEIWSWEGRAKAVGTLLSIGGAMVLTFYKGPEIEKWSTSIPLLSHQHHHHHSSPHRMLGFLLAVAACLSFAIWLIIQAKLGEKFPFQYSSTALMCAAATVQSVVYAMSTERHLSAWKLGWNVRLLAAAYTGFLASGCLMTLVVWCLRKRGPVFVSVFNPLMLVCVAIFAIFTLNERLHLGSILGGLLIATGLYAMLWAKGVEMKRMAILSNPKSSGDPESFNVGPGLT